MVIGRHEASRENFATAKARPQYHLADKMIKAATAGNNTEASTTAMTEFSEHKDEKILA